MIKKLIFIFMLFVGLQAFSISIDQPSIFLETEVGSEESFHITVTNKNSFPVNIKVYAQDWQYNEQGAKSFLPEARHGLAQWLKLPQDQEFQLVAFAEKKLNFTVETPVEARGGKVGVIFFQTDLPNQKGLSYSARIGSIIYQHTKDRTNYQMELVKALYYKNSTDNILELAVLNKGDGYNFLKGTVTLLDATNKPLHSQNFKMQALPEERQDLQLKFPVGSDKLIVTAEDLKGHLVSKIVTLGSKTDVEQQNNTELLIREVKLAYDEPNLKIFLQAFGNINKSITTQLKILNSLGQTIKTVSLGKKFLEGTVDFTNEWEAGTHLNKGRYLLKIEFLDNSGQILTELNVGQLTKNQQLILDVFNVDGRKLKI